jgi:hypothetical protein
LAVDELTAGDEAVEHQSHLAARVDNNVVALPCDLNQTVIIVERLFTVRGQSYLSRLPKY